MRNAKSKISLKAKRKGAKVLAKAKVGVSTVGDYGPAQRGPVSRPPRATSKAVRIR